MTPPALEFCDVHAAHPGSPAVLHGVTFSLDRGDRAGLIGANGSGKSTLLHAALGLLPAISGEIRHDGRICRNEADFVRARRDTGLLFQDPDDQLFCATVEEDLAFGPFNLGLDRGEVETRVDETLDRLAIRHLRRRVTYRLSMGEKKLVALGTLLTMRPRVLVASSSPAVGSSSRRTRVLRLLAGSGETILLASHDAELLQAVTTRRFVLREGRLESSY